MPENLQGVYAAIDHLAHHAHVETTEQLISMEVARAFADGARRQLALRGKRGPQSGPRTGGSGYSGWDALQATACEHRDILSGP
jgi:hypothetical protein